MSMIKLNYCEAIVNLEGILAINKFRDYPQGSSIARNYIIITYNNGTVLKLFICRDEHSYDTFSPESNRDYKQLEEALLSPKPTVH